MAFAWRGGTPPTSGTDFPVKRVLDSKSRKKEFMITKSLHKRSRRRTASRDRDREARATQHLSPGAARAEGTGAKRGGAVLSVTWAQAQPVVLAGQALAPPRRGHLALGSNPAPCVQLRMSRLAPASPSPTRAQDDAVEGSEPRHPATWLQLAPAGPPARKALGRGSQPRPTWPCCGHPGTQCAPLHEGRRPSPSFMSPSSRACPSSSPRGLQDPPLPPTPHSLCPHNSPQGGPL